MSDTPCGDCPLDPSRRAFLLVAGTVALRPELITSLRRVGADPSYPIPAKDGVQIDKKEDVILVRWKNAMYAFNLSCPHQNTALHWNERDTEFQCPKHHSRYQPDGTFIDGRATRNMDRFSITRVGDAVVVHVDSMHKNDTDNAGWSASVVQLSAGALHAAT